MEHEPDVLTARRGTARRGQATPTQIAALIATATTSITARSAEPALTVALATILSEVREVRRFGSATQVRAHFGRCSRDTQSGTYAGNCYVRRLIWILVVGVVSRPGPLRDYFA